MKGGHTAAETAPRTRTAPDQPIPLQARGFRPGRRLTLACTALGLAGMLATMCGSAPFSDPDAAFPATSRALYAAMAPLTWSLALALVVIVTVLGEQSKLLALQSALCLQRLAGTMLFCSHVEIVRVFREI